MAHRIATTFGLKPWQVDRLPHKVRAEMIDYMLDAAEYQAEAFKTDDDDNVEDIDVDKLNERRKRGLA